MKFRRMVLGLTQAEVARRAKLAREQISVFENCKAVPGPNQALRIANALKMGDPASIQEPVNSEDGRQ
jgi:transcriptional regulator with XRE-family HTH domain